MRMTRLPRRVARRSQSLPRVRAGALAGQAGRVPYLCRSRTSSGPAPNPADFSST